MVAFDRCRSAEVHDVGTVTSRLSFPKATVGYYATRYTGAEATMVMVPETTVAGYVGCYASSSRFH
jgi:hypothetical protein